MIVYHSTRDAETAAAIMTQGFRDATGSYLTDSEHSGVWVSDRPLSAGEGGVIGNEPLLRVDVPEDVLREYEWVEDGKGYREWLVPAMVLNQHPRYFGAVLDVDDYV